MKYIYTATKIDGGETKGSMEAKSRFEVAKSLREQGYTIVTCEEAKLSKKLSVSLNIFKGKASLSDKINFSHNLSAMISAGLSLLKSLEILQKQTKKEGFKEVIDNINISIKQGISLNESMKKHTDTFSPLFIAMVKVGEETGKLSETLEIIAEQLEQDYTLRKKVKGAMMYPSIILVAMGIIGVLMLIYVIPTLVGTFKDLGAELPASTKIIIGISDFLINHIVLFFLSLAGFILIFWTIVKSPQGKKGVNIFLLKMPLVSSLVKKINSARTARTLASLVSSGLDVVESISITQEVLQNHKYIEVLEQTKKDVQKGVPISDSFKKAEDLYPIQVGEMISVGEETGQLSDMLLRLATFYEDEVDGITKNLSTIIEPLLMVIIGIAVGFFAVSMIKPMYSVMESV